MNFDGKALVVNQSNSSFYSSNDFAVVMPENFAREFNQCMNRSHVIANNLNTNNRLNSYTIKTINNLIPYTIQVYNKNTLYKTIKLEPSTNIYVTDASLDTDKFYEPKRVKVSDLYCPTNMLTKEVSTYVTDTTKIILSKDFPITCANVTDKTEITIPSVSTGYQEISIVVQKNNFIELKFSDTVTNVIGLPDGLECILGVIKGTITKSGTYDITIQYGDSSQKLNIIVPYYQRLL